LAGGGPNILVVLVDDVGVDKIGVYADDADPTYRDTATRLPQTPVIDALAERGVRFTDAWATPSCSPTRAALYTGRLPFRTGIGDPVETGEEGLSPDEVTLPALLSEAGYATALFGKWHLGEGTEADDLDPHALVAEAIALPPRDMGFEHFSGTLASLDDYYLWTRLTTTLGDRVRADPLTSYATQQTTEDALDWIADQRDRWFATVAYHAPHLPLGDPPRGCQYSLGPGETAEDRRERHRAMVECVDQQLGELLDGAGDDTVVVFLGDNGTDESFTEGPFNDGRGKASIYESGIRVPLIVAGPDVAQDLRIAQPVHVTDLFTTLAELGRADSATGDDGLSIAPALLDGGTTERSWIYTEMIKQGAIQAGFRVDDHKLIIKIDHLQNAPCLRPPALYDLSVDRFEQDDLAEQEPGRVVELWDDLLEALDGEPGSWPEQPDC